MKSGGILVLTVVTITTSFLYDAMQSGTYLQILQRSLLLKYRFHLSTLKTEVIYSFRTLVKINGNARLGSWGQRTSCQMRLQ
jgi:hypothetical protein